MAGFTVDTDAVQDLGSQIARAGGDLANTMLSGELSEVAAGSPELSRALGEFHSHWRAAQTSLLDNLAKIANAITQAANGYDQSDSAVAGAAETGELQ